MISKIIALILDIIHNIDVVDQLNNDRSILQSKNTNDWSWYKQLKYYLDRSQVSKVGMCDAFFDYTYEY